VNDERREFLVETAWLHHEHGLTQEEIARRFSVSRSTVSRALADAERLGIVQVTVTVPVRREARLAAALGEQLGVTATVGARIGDETSMAAAARAAARLVERISAAGRVTIAASWGRTLAATANQVRPRATVGVTVVDAVGHAGGDQMVPAVDVTRRLAAALGAGVVHLPSPAFVDSSESRAVLLALPPVERALDIARGADVTMVSVGVVGAESLLVEEQLVAASDIEWVARAGAVGEILGRWFDAAGRDVATVRTPAVGLSLDDLRAARRAIGVAGGANKAASLRAALAGGIVREIVVDDELAAALLEGPSSGGAPRFSQAPGSAEGEAASDRGVP
jgi:DNA-binding transcriptional regulator LsrR (DeoR family)